MTEQERATTKFPRVSIEVITQLKEKYLEYPNPNQDKIVDHFRELMDFMGKREPILLAYFKGQAERMKTPTHFLFGALLIFKALESTESKLHPVSTDTINAYASLLNKVVERSIDLILDFENSSKSEGEKLSFYKAVEKKFKEVELNPASPTTYADENPHLTDFLNHIPHLASLGGFLMYEFKRRQFLADQLAKKFGG